MTESSSIRRTRARKPTEKEQIAGLDQRLEKLLESQERVVAQMTELSKQLACQRFALKVISVKRAQLTK